MSLPAKRMVPERGSRPETARSTVVLPPPLGPSSATASPAPTRRSMPRSTPILPYPEDRPLISSRGSGAEIGTHHLPMRADLRRRARRQNLAEIEHGHAIANVEDQVGVVLDQKHRRAFAADGDDQGAETPDLVRRQAGRRLVQHETGRAQQQGASDVHV